MTYTLTLSDGTTTVDLLSFDGSVGIGLTGFEAPEPRKLARTVGGPGRDGADVLGATYENRRIVTEFEIWGSSSDNLYSREREIRRLLERAEAYSRFGWGELVTLTYQPSDATLAAVADVLSGELQALDLAGGWLDQHHTERVDDAIGKYRLTLTCRPFLRGTRTSLAAQTAANLPAGIRYRYLFDSPTLRAANIAGRVAGPLWVDTNAASPHTTTTQITPASGDYVALGDPDGTFTRLSFGVSTPLAYSVAPDWQLEYSTAAGWSALPGVTIHRDADPSGVALANGRDLFAQAGEVELRFAAPGDWAAATHDGLASAYWLRLRQTATLGTVTAQPVLQWGPFRNGRGLVRIAAADVKGDVPARAEVKIVNTSASAVRRVRAALLPALRKEFGVPHLRHGAEYATGANAGAYEGSPPAGSRGEGAIKVGAATSDFAIEFDGSTNGYLDWATTNFNPSLTWTVDFWLRLYADATSGVLYSGPMPIVGSWDSTNTKRKLLILVDEGYLTVLLSTDGTSVVKQDEPYDKKGALNAKAKYLRHPTPLAVETDYFVRVTRNGADLEISLGTDRMNTVKLGTKAVSGKADSLGASALYTAAPVDWRLGQQLALAAADTISGRSVQMLRGRVEQVRFTTAYTRDNVTAGGSGTRFGEFRGNNAGTSVVGLFEFNTAPGVLVNSQTSAPVMANATRSGAGTTDVVGRWQSNAYVDVQARLALSWALLDGYRGAYRVLAVVRSASGTSHKVAASQGGYRLDPKERSVSASGVWQVLDLGVARLPYQPGGTYSPLGPTTDPAEELGVLVGNTAAANADFYVDEILLVPLDHWSALLDTGSTSARGIQQNEAALFSSLTEPPLAIQLGTDGKQRHNPDLGGMLGDPVRLVPGRDNWLFVATERVASLESNGADAATVTVTVEPQYLSVDAL